MKKLAVFVEGMTEQVFVAKLFEAIAGQQNVLIEQTKIRGGAAAQRTATVVNAARPKTDQRYYVLIVDCGGDHQVKTRIAEEHVNLTNSAFSKIIGIRDVRPTFTHADIPRLQIDIRKYIKSSLIPVEFVLSIMEVEAWFLAEANHFTKIDPSITLQAIKASLGIDPSQDDMTLRVAPSDDLKACYALGLKTYTKGDGPTIAALDYASIYIDLQKRIASIKQLVDSFDEFLD